MSQRQSPAASAGSVFVLQVRHGDPFTVCFTRVCSAAPLYQTNSISLSVAFITRAKHASFPALAGKDSAAPTSAFSATDVPTAASADAPDALAVVSCANEFAALAASTTSTTGQYLRIRTLGRWSTPKMRAGRDSATKKKRPAFGG